MIDAYPRISSLNELNERLSIDGISADERAIIIQEINAIITSFNAEVTSLENELRGLNESVSSATEVITKLTAQKESLEISIDQQTEQNKELNLEHKALKDDIEQFKIEIIQVRDKSNLYTKDLAGIGEDLKNKLDKYLNAILFCSGLLLIFVIGLICVISKSKETLEIFTNQYQNYPRISITGYLITRFSMITCFVVLIIVMVNQIRAFISQYIKAQDKKTSITNIDFLLSQLEKDTTMEKANILAAQVKLLNEHIPSLIENKANAFDKPTKTVDYKDIVSLIKEVNGKIPTT